MNTIIVGGNFGDTPKESSIVNKLSIFLKCDRINGGSFDRIKNIDLSGYKLIIWMPNIDNGYDKVYPKKDTGSVLICSKLLHDERTEVDAISRIFQLHGNAVIAISSKDHFHRFKLLDALGNVWKDTYNIGDLADSIGDLYDWTTSSIRKGCINSSTIMDINFQQYQDFVDINKMVADKFEVVKGRYFGNCSTRCALMFPSMKLDDTHMIVSKRNVSKQRLTVDDLVLTHLLDDGSIEYYGNSKPSVDTPIQIQLYSDFPEINYMIHGHTYVEGGTYTDHYFPCGDMREYHELRMFIRGNFGIINLKNHGFLIYSSSLNVLGEMVKNMKFIEREIGNETI